MKHVFYTEDIATTLHMRVKASIDYSKYLSFKRTTNNDDVSSKLTSFNTISMATTIMTCVLLPAFLSASYKKEPGFAEVT